MFIKAMARAVNLVQKLAEKKGERPYMRFAACWSDGEQLFAARMASDRFAPSLFVKKCEEGYIVLSEPLENDCSDWCEIQAGEAIEIGSGEDVSFHAFDAQSSTDAKTLELQAN
ncbi:class II glutamine amidotransferase [Tateyamaria sp.]|uniref:class II glutamine amidotransferase n=1 Tax=Tateyamaria sp. TaxID=1929288 RepID=UPI0032A0CC8D